MTEPIFNPSQMYVEEWDTLSSEEQENKINSIKDTRYPTYQLKKEFILRCYDYEKYRKNQKLYDDFNTVGYKKYCDLSIEEWDNLTKEEKEFKLSSIIQPIFPNPKEFCGESNFKKIVENKYNNMRSIKQGKLKRVAKQAEEQKKIDSKLAEEEQIKDDKQAINDAILQIKDDINELKTLVKEVTSLYISRSKYN